MKKKLFSLLKKEAFFSFENLNSDENKKTITLSSGKTSSYYIDVRRVSLGGEGVYLISHLIYNVIKSDDITAIGGPTLGADPIVSGVCYLSYKHKKNLKGFLIRKEPKKYGRQNLIEGKELISGEKVVLIDDVATSGSSLIKAIEILNKENVKILKCIVVVDRDEGAGGNLSRLNCPLVSLFKGSDFIKK